ncbi:MAG: DUF2490 domain-containing protein [Bacteroidetes bacterium]|nr:DUF2490 domain-containing protein [Bacteroidota bacterium]MDA0903727.1 DUF2490 domain-containing protein [Bacteroidota bacterium]MDA1242453.1 DUF2490 domain-containing protein [Bacteroidota bacterium]
MDTPGIRAGANGGRLPRLAMWLAFWIVTNQAFGQAWTGGSVAQKFRNDWSWSTEGQLRSDAWRVQEGLIDAGVSRAVDAVHGLDVSGQWRTAWSFPMDGGWKTSWRWATSAQYKVSFGKDDASIRFRHQWGGDWMRPWDEAKWRARIKWTHDLPDGWKLVPSAEGFWGRSTHGSLNGPDLEMRALRGRLDVDKKLDKRRHLVVGYQWQTNPQTFASVEHRLILSLDVDLKKPKKRPSDSSGEDA